MRPRMGRMKSRSFRQNEIAHDVFFLLVGFRAIDAGFGASGWQSVIHRPERVNDFETPGCEV